ncbi:DUF333 domain-containing protein [Vibrio aquaticus]|uniref:DUF333 domain-containing protein n=1 Tax=Vibrio aquaticus TaxID=2496559 RepID=A0A3S0ML43_9VIBR|nr:DUF333 domain-containing protein [Vibrio aquaticus]RTZ17574.1 DUF333 domain-containing protein [Vibrio aquaticus]
MKKAYIVMSMVGAIALTGCASEQDEYEVKEYTSMANPAAVYCVQKGGELETVSESDQRITYCVLSDEERVEQWEYYRNNHKEESTN